MNTIIIQETDRHVLEVLQTALTEENFNVYAMQHCDEDFMRLIEIFNRIRMKYPHLPLIALSCNHNINTVAPELGFDGYIPKPFDLDELYRTLRRFIPSPHGTTTDVYPAVNT
jgi:DNA-binding response OmpR family regulator